MPSSLDAGTPPEARATDRTPAEVCASPAFQLALANRALWAATLSLMTAYMANQAPAHRCLLARRISRNFDTLSRQDCFDSGCRSSFGRLARRWHARAEQLAPDPRPTRTALANPFF
ncbi:MAG TPA: hypothetical protein VGD76_02800 [Ramlibacter sp.]